MMKLLPFLLVGCFYALVCGTSVSENLGDIQEKFTNTENEIKELKLLIYRQKEQIDYLSREMDNLQRKMLEQDKEITTLKKQVVLRTKHDEKLNEDNKNPDTNKIKGMPVKKMMKQKKKSGPTGSVAFSAFANKLMITKENETIPFGTVQLNEGNAFNATSSVFTCPKSGLYLFSFHILSFNSEQPDGSSAAVWLAVNGIPFVLSQQTVRANGNKDYNIHGSTVIRLNAGDRVLIASVIDGTNVYILSSYFNGVRLEQNGSSSSVAFSAIADTIITAKQNETIIFGYVQLNEGNGYNSSSGVFVCPRSGLYQFSYHIFTFYSYQYGGDAAGVWLSVNDTPFVMTQETAPAKDVNYNIHGSTVVRLNQGDNVLIGSGINGTLVFLMSSYFNGVRVAD